MSPTVFLLLALVLQTVNASDFTKYLSEFNNFNLLLLSNVTPHCVEDMAIFGASIARIATTVKSCIDQKGCNDEQKKILDDNMFAVKQLDSFGKLPAGIMEITTISSGSYIECRDLIAPYEPHYCYAGITVKNLDIPLLLKTIINEETLPIKFRSANCVPTNVQPTTAFWIFMIFMAFFVSWAILASIVDYFLDAHYQSENIRKTTDQQASRTVGSERSGLHAKKLQ